MFVTREEYSNFGHDLIPEAKFLRTINKAGMIAQQQTLGRVTDETLNPPDAGAPLDPVIQQNKMGICELADLIYSRETIAIGASGVPISSFKNAEYSESISSGQANPIEFERAYNNQIVKIISIYFTLEQCSRVGGG